MKYPAIIEYENGVYGVLLPDVPGLAATGETLREAVDDAADMLAYFAEHYRKIGEALTPPSDIRDVDVPDGAFVALIPLRR